MVPRCRGGRWTILGLSFPRESLAAFVLAAVVFGVFFHAVSNGFLNYDDDAYVTDNLHVQRGLSPDAVRWALRTSEAGNWHPLTWISHMVDCQLYGLNPWGHHLTNVVLHSFNTVLVFLVLRGLTGAFWRSLFVGGLFGLHPLHVESVAWIAERKDVLSAAFFLLTIAAYLRFRKASERQLPSRLGAVSWYALSLLLFAGGLMSKPMLVTLPFVLLLLDYWPLSRFERPLSSVNRVLLEKVPFFLLAAGSCVITVVAQGRAEAVEPLWRLPLAERLANAVVSYCRYLGKFFYPQNLSVFYPYPVRWPDVAVVLAAVFLGLVSLAALVWRRRFPWLLVGWCWFMGTLVPVIGLVQVGSQSMADRYSYVPLIGIFVIMAWGVWEATQGWRSRRLVLAMAGGLALASCAGLTWRQLGFWKNSRTLFEHAEAVTGNTAVARLHIGNHILLEGGNLQEAIGYFQAAVRLEPKLVEAHSQLGTALYKAGRRDEGLAELEQAIRLNPGYAPAHLNLGIAFLERGRTDAAIAEFQAALRYKAEYPEAHNGLGAAFGQTGRLDESIEEFETALRMKPDDPGTHCNLGMVLVAKGRRREAIEHFNTALRLHPHYRQAEEHLRALQSR